MSERGPHALGGPARRILPLPVAQCPLPCTGPRAQRLAAYERCLGILILMNTASRRRVLLVVTDQPLSRRDVPALIVRMAVQLRARRNRGEWLRGAWWGRFTCPGAQKGALHFPASFWLQFPSLRAWASSMESNPRVWVLAPEGKERDAAGESMATPECGKFRICARQGWQPLGRLQGSTQGTCLPPNLFCGHAPSLTPLTDVARTQQNRPHLEMC